jgi:hypothetical protein
MSLIRSATILIAVLAALSGCVSPRADGSAAGVSSAFVSPKPAAGAAAAATVGAPAEGQGVALAELAKATRSDCYSTANSLIREPTAEELAAADQQVGSEATGVDIHGRTIGDETALVARYADARVVARTEDARSVFLLATTAGVPSAIGFQSFETPGGHVVWVKTFEARASSGCG